MARGKKYTVKKGYLDVVCRKWLEEKAINRVKKNGKVYYFCSYGCEKKFRKNPDKYLEHSRSEYNIREIIAIDVETTGLYPNKEDRICEIALLRIKDGNITEKFVTLVNPEKEIPSSTTRYNGITNAMVKKAPTFREIAKNVVSFIKREILLTHNAVFDLSFLEFEMKRCGIELPEEIEVIDTLEISKKYFNFPRGSLQRIVHYLNIPQEDFHRAESDAWTAYIVFLSLFKKLKKKNVILKDLVNSYRKKKIIFKLEENLELVKQENLWKAKRISIKYKGDVLWRDIYPIEILKKNGNFYLIGFCFLRKKERTISIKSKRIEQLKYEYSYIR